MNRRLHVVEGGGARRPLLFLAGLLIAMTVLSGAIAYLINLFHH